MTRITEAEADSLMNSWGTECVMAGGSRCGSTFHEFDADVRRSVPGYQLDICLSSGTFANHHAALKECDGDLEAALFGIGSYLGGLEYFQETSTAGFSSSNTFSVPKLVENATPHQIKRTAVLPYTLPNSADIVSKELEKFEDRCLRLLQKRLLRHMLDPRLKRIRVILMEYILSGNGAELRETFLIKLAHLLKAFDVVVIADEVMTGGRAGPCMTMTESLPAVWKECVSHITMGKWMGCGVVLRKTPKNVDKSAKEVRGLSTKLSLGPPHQAWKAVQKKIENGDLMKRQQEVINSLNLNNKTHGNPLVTVCHQTEFVWGRGLLLFSKYTRPINTQSLKNRMLPRLQPKMKIRKGRAEVSSWTRSKMAKNIMSSLLEWVKLQEEQMCSGSPEVCFMGHVLDFLFSGTCELSNSSSEDPYFVFRSEDVVDYLGGEKEANKIAAKACAEFFSKRKRKVLRDAGSFVRAAIVSAESATDDWESGDDSCGSSPRLVYKKRRYHKRIQCVHFHSKLLGKVSEQENSFIFWS